MPGTDSPHSYRDFIRCREQMYISDWEILELLSESDSLSPYDIANQQLRENVIRLQLRDLNRIGAVNPLSHDSYKLSERGAAILRDETALPSEDGLFDAHSICPEQYPEEEWCMNDFSNLDGETIKELNYQNMEDKSEEYGWVRDSPDLTRQRIQNVPDTDLHRAIREFPTHDPLPQQCAHWLRALAGMHWFPDANHRTAFNSLSVPFLAAADRPLPPAPDIKRVVLESKLSRHLLSDVRFNTLWERDELYQVWHRYFRRILCGDGNRRHEPPEHHLRLVLNYARSIL